MPQVKRPIHTAQRALSGITLGVARSRQKAVQRDIELGLREEMLHFQSAISGLASTLVAFGTLAVQFDYDFYYAPGNRDSDLARPQFWFGVESADDILVTANVSAWDDDVNSGATVGATLRIAVLGPDEDGASFEGVLHTTFQGFGALTDGQSTDDVVA